MRQSSGDIVLVEGNNELNVEMVPIALVGVEILSITLDKTMLVEEDAFTISITFSNPLDYDVWVKPEFGFGLLTGEPLEFVLEPPVGPPRPRLILKGFEAEAVLSGWEYYYEPHGYSGRNTKWVDLGHPQHPGSNMPQFVYDPDGIPVLMAGGECWLKVPAKGQATTSRRWYISNSARSRGWIEWRGIGWGRYPIHHVEVYPPIDLDVCVKVDKPFYLVHDPGWATRTVGGVTVTVNYRPISLEPLVGAVPDVVNVRSEKTPK